MSDFDQLAELGAVALDAERIGERERDLAAGVARERRGAAGSRPWPPAPSQR